MLVTPAAAASLITKKLRHMMFTAVFIAAGSGIVGLYASFYLNIASGAAIVLTCTLVFILIWLKESWLRTRSAPMAS
jgi:manganese/iron transport system permease protein